MMLHGSIFDSTGGLIAIGFIVLRLFIMPMVRRNQQRAQEQSRNVEVSTASTVTHGQPIEGSVSAPTTKWAGPTPASHVPSTSSPIRGKRGSNSVDRDPRGPFL